MSSTTTIACAEERATLQARWVRNAPKRAYTIPQIVTSHARMRPDAAAFRFLDDDGAEHSTLTFGELDRQAQAIAAGIEGHRGERALLLYVSGPEFVAALVGCLRAGVVAVHAPLVVRHDSDGLASRAERVAQDSAPALVMGPAVIVAQREALSAEGPTLAALPWVASDTLAERGGVPTRPLPEIGDMAIIQYTSGTTGTARGTVLAHSHLTLQACWAHCGAASNFDTVSVGWMPLFHDMGLFLSVMEPLYTGHEAVVLTPQGFLQNPVLWPQVIDRYGASVSGGPNFSYELLIRRTTPEQRAELDLSCWKLAVNGAEPILPATLERFAEAFAPAGFDPDAMCPAYGLAEATCGVSARPRGLGPGVRTFSMEGLAQGRAVEAPDGAPVVSAGVAYGDQQWVVVDPATGTPLNSGEIGELWLRGPGVGPGYWRRPAEQAAIFDGRLAGGAGPFLRTGDMAFIIEEELFIVGRLKDLIIIQGRNIFCHDVEASVQASHPSLVPGGGVAFTVLGDFTEALVIMQEIRAGSTDDPDTVKEAIRQAVLNEHSVDPYAIVLLPPHAIPKTTSGKLQRSTCRQSFLEGRAPMPPREQAEDESAPYSPP